MKYGNYLIVATFFSLWMSGFLTQSQQQTIALILILSLGVIHGAHDIFITKKMLKEKFQYFRILGLYLLSVVSFALLYTFSPPVLMAVFVFFSAYHFGEQHWLDTVVKKGILEIGFAFCYGLVIIVLLLRINFLETEQILSEMSSFQLNKNLLNIILGFASIALVVSSWFLKSSRIPIKKRIFRELVVLAVLAVIFSRSSLVWGFAIYFVIWHSIPSILSQLRYMNGKVSWKSFFNYLKDSTLYWLTALTGLLVLFYFARGEKQILLSIFLPFIAALTFPHALIISHMFKRTPK
ncbi:Brp/Blh family beta-carotene 15,15'-dioxygenase [Gillisia limnaea]|uniref:Probable beta-carotene 15,15'-dioxygenase n=1 Tax=Gillisia limnaea (strain DSM 15749 / LMG 21470 / R-8282) TaxID=865937 RepID=H2BR48_GILLR|nr:Brp/Blh family beta-carotene 15,15'-dioxygenase [Gillisia limnaea]EHQ04367.1 beta-carotene 15,15'-monooxygenase, Brp/Blh family [Gillisia limnaea DSM 15749]